MDKDDDMMTVRLRRASAGPGSDQARSNQHADKVLIPHRLIRRVREHLQHIHDLVTSAKMISAPTETGQTHLLRFDLLLEQPRDALNVFDHDSFLEKVLCWGVREE